MRKREKNDEQNRRTASPACHYQPSVQALAQIEMDGGTLSAEQLEQFTGLQAQFDELSASIQRLEAAERLAATTAVPVKAAQNGRNAPAVHAKAEPPQYKGAGMTRMVMAIAAGKGDLQQAAAFAAEDLNKIQGLSMAISTAANSGGALVPQNMQNEVIELLRDRTIVRKLGARSIPLPNGNLAIPRLASGSTASYVGEGKDVKASGATFDDVKLNAKTLITMVPILQPADWTRRLQRRAADFRRHHQRHFHP